MNDSMQAAMAEATRLTRAGRLAEATAMIQRILGNASPVDASTAGFGSDAAPIEAEFRVVDDSPPSMERPMRSAALGMGAPTRFATARPATRTDVFSPGTFRWPDSIRSVPEYVCSDAPKVMPSSARAGGQFVAKTYSNRAGTRAYKLYIPSGYTGQAVPLVVMLHGCTQAPVDFAAGTRMNVLAEGETFLVAYPEQAPSANGSKCWNWFQESDQHRDVGEPSLIAGITRQIMGEYSVDVRRVYVAGLSSGGAMAVIMAVTYPDLYAAVGVHSGLAYGAAHDMPSAFAAMKQGTFRNARPLAGVIPLIVFHGDRDTTVAPINADRLCEQWLQSASDGPASVSRSARDVNVKRGQVVSGHAYTRFSYSDGSGRTLIEKWMVHQAGHAWSGGNRSGSYTDSKGPDASVEMMRFFTEHSKER